MRVSGDQLPRRQLTLASPLNQTVVMGFETFISTMRSAQRSEPFRYAGGGTIPDDEDIDTLQRPASIIVGRLTVESELAIIRSYPVDLCDGQRPLDCPKNSRIQVTPRSAPDRVIVTNYSCNWVGPGIRLRGLMNQGNAIRA